MAVKKLYIEMLSYLPVEVTDEKIGRYCRFRYIALLHARSFYRRVCEDLKQMKEFF